MPNFDGTGPQGKGPMTGRGMGKCGQNKTDNSSTTPALSMGRGRGAGRGSGTGRGRGAGRGTNAGRGLGRNA